MKILLFEISYSIAYTTNDTKSWGALRCFLGLAYASLFY